MRSGAPNWTASSCAGPCCACRIWWGLGWRTQKIREICGNIGNIYYGDFTGDVNGKIYLQNILENICTKCRFSWGFYWGFLWELCLDLDEFWSPQCDNIEMIVSVKRNDPHIDGGFNHGVLMGWQCEYTGMLSNSGTLVGYSCGYTTQWWDNNRDVNW